MSRMNCLARSDSSAPRFADCAPARALAGSALLLLLLGSPGCGSYAVTHDVGAGLLGETAPDLGTDAAGSQPAARPAAQFPVRLAVAHLSGEREDGRQRVTAASSPELDRELMAIEALPQVTDVAVLNRVVLEGCGTMKDVRDAALGLQADILLAWTVDSRTEVDDHDIGPFGLATLGFAPNQEATATVTASAAFIDTRTGFVYGVAEASESRSKLGNAHNTDDIARDVRRDARLAAIESLRPEVERAWKTIVARFGT